MRNVLPDAKQGPRKAASLVHRNKRLLSAAVRTNGGSRNTPSSLFPIPTSSSSSTSRRLEGYYDADGDDAYADFGFDVSSYSLKYAACSSITTYSNDLAADEDYMSPYKTAQLVIFRLCPSNTCNDDSTYGCAYDYGEYAVPLADWLEIMAEYRAEELERYCDFCDECMADEYYNERKRRLADDDGANDDGANDDACAYYNQCKGYKDKCNMGDDDADDNDNQVDPADYFGCVNYDFNDRRQLEQGYYNNNAAENYYDDAAEEEGYYNDDADDYYYAAAANNEGGVYIGPHCDADKQTIVLGAFYDENCWKYNKNINVNRVLGSAVDLSEYYSADCIACKESDLPYQQQGEDDDAADGDAVSEVCENLYGYAAKCNSHIGGATEESYESENQYDSNYATCSFLKSVVTGSYDEDGYIYVDTDKYLSDNVNNKWSEYSKKNQVVTGSQTLMLVGLCLAVAFLMCWTSYLRRRVNTLGSRFTNDGNAFLKEKISIGSRQNSGILMCRSDLDEKTQANNQRVGGVMM